MPCHQRSVRLVVNRRPAIQTVPAHASLGELLRDGLGLTGTKIACDQAACGACTVLLDGRAVFACHTLAAQVDGATVTTIEGLSRDDALDPLQQAFVDHDAMQCGFCTPGMVMALTAALQDARDAGTGPDRAMLATAISGNVCRCGAYAQILDAALSVVAR